MLLLIELLVQNEVSDPVHIFVGKEDLDSNAFRIPSLFTLKSGRVVAGIDIRYNGCGDPPANIDSGIAISDDNGKTWGPKLRIANLPGGASTVDGALLQDSETNVLFFAASTIPQGYGAPGARQGSGFESFQDERCLVLYDGQGQSGQNGQGNKFYIKSDKTIYDSQGQKTAYTINEDFDLLQAGQKVGNIFLPDSPLKLLGTTYISLLRSYDEGNTWSKIELINYFKADWMKHLGMTPGRGHQVQNGKYKGRLLFPCYFTNPNGFMSSAIFYSDDHGETWALGKSPNDHRDGSPETAETLKDGNQISECQVVEMPNGQLKLFHRTHGASGQNQVKVATSNDGGASWEPHVDSIAELYEPSCQLTVINYDGEIDGKKAIIFANPTNGRNNGVIRIGLISEAGDNNYAIEWKYKRMYWKGPHSYSCLTQLKNGNVAVFYEPFGGSCVNIDFVQMDIDWIKQGE